MGERKTADSQIHWLTPFSDSVSAAGYMNSLGIMGPYIPGFNDCHTALINPALKMGGVWMPNGNYEGRIDNAF